MFEVRGKCVIGGYIFPPFSGEVLGCKLGDTPEDVLKKLGPPRSEGKPADGKQTMIWDFKDRDQTLTIKFENNKFESLLVALKD